MTHPVEIDLLERAREHRWWYSDTNMATLLMHEVERLREHHKLAVDNWTLEAQTVKQQEDEIHALKAEIEKLRAVQEAQQRELVIRAHNQTRHLEEVQKLRSEIDALQRLVQREQAEVYRLSTVFIKPGEHE